MLSLQQLSLRFSRLYSLQSMVQTWRPLVCAHSFSLNAATKEETKRQVVIPLRLNNLRDNPGAVHNKRRVGRGIGSSKGKTSGRGHKGQKSRSGGNIHPLFEGGQTKLHKLIPKRGFNNKVHATPMVPINVGTLQMYIDMGRLDPSREIGIREMQLAGIFKANAVKHGVKLLGSGGLKQPVHLQVNRASQSSVAAVENAGGSVTTVHYNRLALRYLLRPQKFIEPPRFARPPPKFQPYYTNMKNRGYLNPVIQMKKWLAKNPQYNEQFEKILKANQCNS